MGTIVGAYNWIGAGRRTVNIDHVSYSVSHDITASSPNLTRGGDLDMAAALPIHQGIRRCLVADNDAVTYLHPSDSTQLATGGAADLSGAAGQVMVEYPSFYYRFDLAGNDVGIRLSDRNFPNARYSPKFWVSIDGATIHRPTGKASSVVSLSADYRGGHNNAAWDAQDNSLLGKSATAISLINAQIACQARWSTGTVMLPYMYDALWILWLTEYATRHWQLAYNTTLTAQGMRQGGLGAGVTVAVSAEWNAFSGYYPFVPIGHTLSTGNGTGLIDITVPNFGGAGVNRTFSVPTWRGLANPFGHIWQWLHGYNVVIQAADSGGRSLVYRNDNIATLDVNSDANYSYVGDLPRNEGYLKEMHLDVSAFLPKVAGGTGSGSTTYYADYIYTSIPASGLSRRALYFGGNAAHGASAGFGCLYSNYGASHAIANVGFRLCKVGA